MRAMRVSIYILMLGWFGLVFGWFVWCVVCLQYYYPDTLYRLFVVNAPFLFRALWAILSPMVDPVTKAKATPNPSTPQPLNPLLTCPLLSFRLLTAVLLLLLLLLLLLRAQIQFGTDNIEQYIDKESLPRFLGGTCKVRTIQSIHRLLCSAVQ
jgi:hypothetical protein